MTTPAPCRPLFVPIVGEIVAGGEVRLFDRATRWERLPAGASVRPNPPAQG